MSHSSLLVLFFGLVAMDTVWCKGDVLTKKELTEEVKDIQKRLNAFGPVALDDGRLLAFRLVAGSGVNALNLYTSVGLNNDNGYRSGIKCDCLTSAGASGCPNYRSSLLDNWPSSLIDTVRLSLWVGGKEKAFVEFNGKDSTYLNWLNATRVVTSSYSDLKTDDRFSTKTGVFSIQGRGMRNFYVPYTDNVGCDIIEGWIFVGVSDDWCDWGRNKQYPAILYAQKGARTKWSSADGRGLAEALTVTIKLQDGAELSQC